MANTVFQHKRSGTPASVPSVLEFGELAINYADGLIFYKNTTSHIVSISGGGGGNAFGTINANGTLVVSDTAGDVLNLVAGTNVTFSVDAVNDIITINASGGGGDVSAPFAVANAAFLAANSAFSNGNTTHTLTIASFGAANASFANGNTNFTTLQTVFGVANAGFLAANSAFANANGTHTLTVASFGAANAAFSNANSTHTLTIASFAAANASFANGNTNFTVLQTVSGVANAAFANANSTHTLTIAAFAAANASFANANTTHTLTIASFNAANAAFSNANSTHTLTIASFAAANASYANANTTHTLAIAAFTQANAALANTSGVAFNGTLYFPSGNVGIGTATPNHAMHIVSAGSTIPNFVIEGDGEQTMRFRNANNTLGASTRVSWKLANRWNTDWQFIWYTDTSVAGANNIVLIGNGTGGNQTLFYGDANTGNVGIGRQTADYKLDVNGSVNASALLVNGLPISGGGLSYTSNVGNNSANTFNITHALNTTTIIPAVRERSTGYYVYPDMKVTSPNNIVLEFVSAPTANQYFLILLGV